MYKYDKQFSKVRNKIEGVGGEIKAVDFLKEKGYNIIETNYTNKLGEIDIIALDGKTLVFVEIKCRSTLAFGRPCEAVDLKKQQKIRKVAELYLLIKGKYYSDCRFDVIEILGDEINHIKNAF